MNVYEMYVANGCRFGYFVMRDSWGNTVAKVVSIEGVIEGEPPAAKKPYFGNPKVMAEFYKVEGAAEMEDPKSLCSAETLQNVSELSSPGNYSYDML